MWMRVSRHRILSLDPTRADSIQLKPITHSESFGLFVKGHEEQMVILGEDLDRAEAIFAAVYAALAEGQTSFDLLPLID